MFLDGGVGDQFDLDGICLGDIEIVFKVREDCALAPASEVDVDGMRKQLFRNFTEKSQRENIALDLSGAAHGTSQIAAVRQFEINSPRIVGVYRHLISFW